MPERSTGQVIQINSRIIPKVNLECSETIIKTKSRMECYLLPEIKNLYNASQPINEKCQAFTSKVFIQNVMSCLIWWSVVEGSPSCQCALEEGWWVWQICQDLDEPSTKE